MVPVPRRGNFADVFDRVSWCLDAVGVRRCGLIAVLEEPFDRRFVVVERAVEEEAAWWVMRVVVARIRIPVLLVRFHFAVVLLVVLLVVFLVVLHARRTLPRRPMKARPIRTEVRESTEARSAHNLRDVTLH